ncbi:MAG: nucleotide exchange factor GrpE, partial [Achromobacter sp.]
MADPKDHPEAVSAAQTLQGEPTPEEREAAQAASEADLEAATVNFEAELAALKARNAELTD